MKNVAQTTVLKFNEAATYYMRHVDWCKEMEAAEYIGGGWYALKLHGETSVVARRAHLEKLAARLVHAAIGYRAAAITHAKLNGESK